jgi:F-type H+-transporting ATPase subunit b
MIDINISLLIAQTVTFLIAVVALWQIAWKPLSTMMCRRKEQIKEDLDMLQSENWVISKLEEGYNVHLDNIHKEAEDIIKKAQAEALKQRESIIGQAYKDAEDIRQKAHKQVNAEEDRVFQEMTADLFVLSVELTERMLQQSVDRRTHEKLFLDTVREFEHLLAKRQRGLPS